MSKLGNYLLKIRNKYFHKNKNTTNRQIISYSKANNIGILFHLKPEENHHALNQFVHDLEKEGKNITALTFFDNLGSNPYNFQFDFFQEKDISYFGSIQSEQVNKFIAQPFDYLFCITLEDFSPFDSILLNSQAKYRVGLYQPNKENYYDMMIKLRENDRNISTFIKEMWKYTKLLSGQN
ncbi:MAG: hypothetical protein NZ551_00850 [Microscillaceae bacterium]|nr:hypothetical protein [Microscillaceae bacterium]MDW8459737.1 hypothetical protein [Cytophagales bacterium]